MWVTAFTTNHGDELAAGYVDVHRRVLARVLRRDHQGPWHVGHGRLAAVLSLVAELYTGGRGDLLEQLHSPHQLSLACLRLSDGVLKLLHPPPTSCQPHGLRKPPLLSASLVAPV